MNALGLGGDAQRGTPALWRFTDPRPTTLAWVVLWTAAIVAELTQVALWVPKVAIDHVPRRFTQVAAGSHDALIGELVAALGYDKASELNLLATVGLMTSITTGGRADGAGQYRSQIEAIKEAMGGDFAARYEVSLRQEIEGDIRRAREQMERITGLP